MAFEGSRKFITPVTLRIKCHVKDDQPGAGIAQLIDELCVDASFATPVNYELRSNLIR
jgi:hypothetical protein